MNSGAHALRIAALVLSAVGVLLVCEVIRPFRDLTIDGPIALGAWTIGTAVGVGCLVRKSRSVAFSIVALVANLLPLLGALAVAWMMSRTNFAWH